MLKEILFYLLLLFNYTYIIIKSIKFIKDFIKIYFITNTYYIKNFIFILIFYLS